MFNLKMFVFNSIPQKEISRENILTFIEDKATKRICFSTFHSKALARSEGKQVGKIVLPFIDTIGPIIQSKLGTLLYQSQFQNDWGQTNYYRLIKSEEEYEQFKDFVCEYNEIVFIRDLLDLSVALSTNFDNENTYTKIGELEIKAKYSNNNEAESELIQICKIWIDTLPFFKYVDYVCAMPDSDKTKRGLPHRIVSKLEGFKFRDISDLVSWDAKDKSAKEAETVMDKLQIAESSGLKISNDIDLKNKTILLFDDLYMSGVTMQYVAMKLKEAGASRVFGMCIVKSRSNTAR